MILPNWDAPLPRASSFPRAPRIFRVLHQARLLTCDTQERKEASTRIHLERKSNKVQVRFYVLFYFIFISWNDILESPLGVFPPLPLSSQILVWGLLKKNENYLLCKTPADSLLYAPILENML